MGVSYNTAKTRAHNILQLAVDLGIIRDHPDFVREFNKAIADKITREEIKKILADCFQRSPGAVSKSVDELFGKLKPDYFKSAAGLTDLWAELSREFDPKPDKKGLAKLLKELSREYQGKDKVFLKKCIDWTRKNLLFSQHPLS